MYFNCTLVKNKNNCLEINQNDCSMHKALLVFAIIGINFPCIVQFVHAALQNNTPVVVASHSGQWASAITKLSKFEVDELQEEDLLEILQGTFLHLDFIAAVLG